MQTLPRIMPHLMKVFDFDDREGESWRFSVVGVSMGKDYELKDMILNSLNLTRMEFLGKLFF